MRKGRRYKVVLDSLTPSEYYPKTFVHHATASNENVTVAFGVSAGTYVATLYENNRLVTWDGRNPVTFTVPETSAIVWDLEHQDIQVELFVEISAPRNVVQGEPFDATIYISVSRIDDMGEEAVEIIEFELSPNPDVCNIDPVGETVPPTIIVVCQYTFNKPGQETITVSVSGRGEITGNIYSDSDSARVHVRKQ